MSYTKHSFTTRSFANHIYMYMYIYMKIFIFHPWGIEKQHANQYQPLTFGDLINSVQHSKYHSCWCPGSLRRQGNRTHNIDYIKLVSCCLTWGRIFNYLCHVNMEIWHKCKSMFSSIWNKIARKGLNAQQICGMNPYAVVFPVICPRCINHFRRSQSEHQLIIS